MSVAAGVTKYWDIVLEGNKIIYHTTSHTQYIQFCRQNHIYIEIQFIKSNHYQQLFECAKKIIVFHLLRSAMICPWGNVEVIFDEKDLSSYHTDKLEEPGYVFANELGTYRSYVAWVS